VEKAANGEIPQEKLEAMANGELSEEELEEVGGGVGGTLFLAGAIGLFIGAILVDDNMRARRRRW